MDSERRTDNSGDSLIASHQIELSVEQAAAVLVGLIQPGSRTIQVINRAAGQVHDWLASQTEIDLSAIDIDYVCERLKHRFSATLQD